jgi:hypothetical protein
MSDISVGIVGVSTQSGRAYLADLLMSNIPVFAYARRSDKGIQTVKAINKINGMKLSRPGGETKTEKSHFYTLTKDSWIGHNIERVVENSDIIILTHPSIYHLESVKKLVNAGIIKKQIPIVLSPSRTLATPYLWKVLGEDYPIISLSTCIYSCKTVSYSEVFIKRRKRTVVASIDGIIKRGIINKFQNVFPQIIFTDLPATTSLGNIGAVFHPGCYLLNWDSIEKDPSFSFYIEGIAKRPEVGVHLEKIDIIRLEIARKLGLNVIGFNEDPQEDKWREVISKVRLMEAGLDPKRDIVKLRAVRESEYSKILHNSIVSAQHWLDYTYGVERIPGETLSDAISRTSSYKVNSVPQWRYIEEDIPTGLIPIKELALRFNINCEPITQLLNIYQQKTNINLENFDRNLKEFSTDYLKNYLLGNFSSIED